MDVYRGVGGTLAAGLDMVKRCSQPVDELYKDTAITVYDSKDECNGPFDAVVMR